MKTRVIESVCVLREKLFGSIGLPFALLLPEPLLEKMLFEVGVRYRKRVFCPIVTLWAWLSQVLEADKSCKNAVSRIISYLISDDLKPPSSGTSGYCRARFRLKEKFLLRLVRLTGLNTHLKQQKSWLWCGREPVVVDGSSFLMADTAENQGEYPQHKNQAKGCGFPIGRIVVLFSLATGAVLDSAISAFCVGEINLFRRLYPHLKAGSVVLGDRIFGTYCDICLLLARGVDVAFRLHGARKTDFRKGKCISRWDHIIHWTKPKKCPVGLTQQQFNALPAQLLLREVRFQIPFKGFRTEDVTLVTTLLDAKLYSMSALAELYRLRWQVELDIRILKTTMKMEHLWSKTPEMIRKEFYIHLLAYNLIRQLQFEAGIESEALPITLSFKATVQHFSNFVVLLAHSIAQRRIHFYHQLIMLISKEILDVRSNRVEPRVVKRRPKSYRRMTVPRKQLKRKCKNRKINPQTAQMTPSY